MAIKLYRDMDLENPTLLACWPGIGNIGIIAVDTLRGLLMAEEFGEIEPWDFFYPKRVLIRNGELKEMQFPSNKFYFKRTGSGNLIFFIAEEQPADGGKTYAEGTKAYQMANLVLDVAIKLGCKRVYTSGAAVAPIHHTGRSRVWAVANTDKLLAELRGYENTVLMSEMQEDGGQGNITGLNGLMLGVARSRGLDAICVMGEIPVYLQGFPFPYPKASRSVLGFLGSALDIRIDYTGIDAMIERSEMEIETLYEGLPSDIREQLERLKYNESTEPNEPGPITEDDKRKILEDVDDFFKKGHRED